MSGFTYGTVRPAVAQTSLSAAATYMFWLMFRNVASDGLVYDDPVNAGIVSAPGLRARLTVVGEQRHPAHPGLRLPLDQGRGDRRARAGVGLRERARSRTTSR